MARHSAIEIPLHDANRVYTNDPEYVTNHTLWATKGSLDKFITDHNREIFSYEGKTEQGIERFKFTEEYRKSQFIVMDELMFIPEDHPLFNCYVITKSIHVKLFLNIVGSLPNYEYKLFQRDLRNSVLATIKQGAD